MVEAYRVGRFVLGLDYWSYLQGVLFERGHPRWPKDEGLDQSGSGLFLLTTVGLLLPYRLDLSQGTFEEIYFQGSLCQSLAIPKFLREYLHALLLRFPDELVNLQTQAGV